MSIKRTNLLYFLFTLLGLPAALGFFGFVDDLLGYDQASTIADYLLWFVLGCIFLKKEDASFFETLPYNKGLKWKTALLIVAITFLDFPLTECLGHFGSEVFGDYLGAVDLETNMIGENLLLNLASIALIPAVFEEMFFRGFFFSPYEKAGGPRKAILLSAFLFGIFHMNFQQAIYAMALGVIIGVLRELTGSMWAGMLLHFINNGYSAFLVTVQKYWWPEVVEYSPICQLGFDTTGQASITIAAAVICTFVVVVLIKKIAAIEGKEEELKGFFAGDKGEGRSLVTVPLILGILVCFAFMCLIAVFMPELEELMLENAIG